MRFNARIGLAAIVAAVATAGISSSNLVANSKGNRTISFYNIHNKETLTVTYMRHGQRDPEAMKKINWMMRDWRRNEATTMDPELIDLLWQVHEELGSREPIHLISGFRSSKTNEKLRSKGGGQAKQSRHILGKAADVHFPDVPIKQLRYSGLVRERGGVGYYPTSGIPFVHLDTGRVRHWPRMPRYELALLFPNGHTKHVPSDGRPLTSADYRIARTQHRDLAQQVAAFFNIRSGKTTRTTLVADAGAAAPNSAPPPASRPARTMNPAARQQVASLYAPPAGPSLLQAPRPALRPAQPASKVANAAPAQKPGKAISPNDRSQLASLFSLASFAPVSRLISPPRPAQRASLPAPTGSLTGGAMPAPNVARRQPALPPQQRLAAIDRRTLDSANRPPRTISDIERAGWSSGWVTAPAFDEEHPDEISYRPFPVAPMLTDSPSPDDPVLITLKHPDVGETLAMLGQDDDRLPLRMRPGPQVVAMMWAQQFKGRAVDLSELLNQDRANPSDAIASRTVETSDR